MHACTLHIPNGWPMILVHCKMAAAPTASERLRLLDRDTSQSLRLLLHLLQTNVRPLQPIKCILICKYSVCRLKSYFCLTSNLFDLTSLLLLLLLQSTLKLPTCWHCQLIWALFQILGFLSMENLMRLPFLLDPSYQWHSVWIHILCDVNMIRCHGIYVTS